MSGSPSQPGGRSAARPEGSADSERRGPSGVLRASALDRQRPDQFPNQLALWRWPQAYAPSRDYDGRFGQWDFRKHSYGRIGDFDSKEEFECAVQLDMLGQHGRLKYWVRNLVNKPGCAFFLQKATGRLWPDFVCALSDGKILVVEYKGGRGWTDAQDDRDMGGLWAELSGGNCRFLMVRNRQWGQMEEALA